MTIPLRLTPFGLEQRGVYLQQDRHDEYYEQLLSPSQSRSTRRDCCCISLLLLGDQNAGKSALLYSLVASKDPMYTALTSLLPIIQGEFSNRREVLSETGGAAALGGADGQIRPAAMAESDPACAATRLTEKGGWEQVHHSLPEKTAADEDSTGTATGVEVEAVEALVRRSRDELPFLDSDVARSAALLSAEDFAFFCTEFGIQILQQHQQQGHGFWNKVSGSRYVLLHLLEFGGDHLDRMHAFYNLGGSCNSSSRKSNSSGSNSTCCGKCTFSDNCSKCDQAAAAALLRQERGFGDHDAALRALNKSEVESCVKEGKGSEGSTDQAPVAPADQGVIPNVSATRATVLAQSLRRSFTLAAEVPLVVYFVNCCTMFTPAVHNAEASTAVTAAVELSSSAFLRLLLRLHACCAFLQSTENRRRPVHFACSRLSCRLAISTGVDEAAGDASAEAVAASATGCCCSGFDEKESFRKAVEALKAFVSMTISDSAAEAGASETVAGKVPVPGEERITSVKVALNQPFESLYSRFVAGADSSSSQNSGSSRTNTISWTPFEDCWGVSECARLKAEDEQLQQCTSVVFLQRLLKFFWDVCSPLPLCSSWDFRGVSAVRVLERNSHSQKQQHPLSPQRRQHEAWGPDWQLCVVSVIAFLARMLALLAEEEGLTEARTAAALGGGAVVKMHEHSLKNKGTLPSMDLGNEEATAFEGRWPKRGENSAEWQHLQLLQQSDIMTGETGRQLISLFSSCARLHRQQQQQQVPSNEVSVDLWLSSADWRDFISDFDPMGGQLQQQPEPESLHKQLKHITLSATGEIVIASAAEGDNLLLLPAATAAAAFTPLALELVSLGCCLPCCVNGGPWGPVVVQLPLDLKPIEKHMTLLLLPQELQKPLAAIQQQLQQAYCPPVPLNPKELLEGESIPCLAAVRLPFHPAVAGLFDSILSSCAREPLSADFWMAGAAAAVAAVTASASGAGVPDAEADAESGRLSKLAEVSNTVGAALSAAARITQALLRQKLQQELLEGEEMKEKALGDKAFINSLQLLLQLAGDAVLLQQMTAAATSAKGSQQQERKPHKPGESTGGKEWQHRTGGPYCSQHQLFWTVSLQPPAAKVVEANIAETRDGAPAANEYCYEQGGNSEAFNCALRSVNKELAVLGLVLQPVLHTIPLH